MKVNVKLLKKVRKLIAEEPTRLKMSTWGRKADPDCDGAIPPCGTVACLAGWTVLAATPKSTWKRLLFSGYLRVRGKVPYHVQYVSNIPFRAAKLLRLNVDECPFDRPGWGVPEVLAWIDGQIEAAQR